MNVRISQCSDTTGMFLHSLSELGLSVYL